MTTTNAPGMASLGGLTVLVVEDDYLIAKEAAILLRDHGAKVLGPIPNTERARALASDDTPDCVLLDINLKGQFVFDLAQEFLDQGVPVIFTSGYNTTVLPDAFQDVPYLQKPLEPRMLIAAVKQESESSSLKRSSDAVR